MEIKKEGIIERVLKKLEEAKEDLEFYLDYENEHFENEKEHDWAKGRIQDKIFMIDMLEEIVYGVGN